MKKFLSKLFGNNKIEQPELPSADIEKVMEEIKTAEAATEPEPGRLIYKFVHQEFDMQLDLEVTGTYRLVALIGLEKRFSFSIRCLKGEYNLLQSGLEESMHFLNGSRQLVNLPKTRLLKGHFFASQDN